ncbi:MAG: hypothetical protein AAGG48_26690 [Planctomycetota bacterium]
MSTKMDYANRDKVILLHVAGFVVTLKEVVSKLFFDQKECGHVLSRLESKGLVKVHSKAIAGRYSFLSITSKGALHAGYPKERGLQTGKVIDDKIGLTYACFLESPYRRYLLSNNEADAVLNARGCFPNNVDIIAADEPNALGLYRVYRPDNAKSAIDGLSVLYESSKQDAAIQRAMHAGVFGVAVLARTLKQKSQLQSVLSGRRNPLGSDCRHLVALAPGVDSLGACLKKRNRKHPK